MVVVIYVNFDILLPQFVKSSILHGNISFDKLSEKFKPLLVRCMLMEKANAGKNVFDGFVLNCA